MPDSTAITVGPAKRSDKLWLVLLLTITVALRIGLSLVSCDIIDVQNYARVATIVRNHGAFALYTQTSGIYPYPPLWVWFETLAQVLSETSGASFGLLIRSPIVLADAGIVCVIWAWHRQRSTRRIFWSAAYALNPVSLIVTCLHGQFDAIPAFLSVLAIYGLGRLHRPYLSAAALALGIAFKPYPVLFLPFMLTGLQSHRQRLAFAAMAIFPVGLLILPFFLHSPGTLTQELFLYKGVALLGMLVPVRMIYVPLMHEHFPVTLTQEIVAISRWLFLGGYAALLAWQMRHHSYPLVIASCAAALLWFYIVDAGISPQYLVWVLPLLLILLNNSLFLTGIYTLTAMLALYGFYTYAVPEAFCFLPSPPAWLARALYGLFGTLWWFASGMCLIWILREKRGHIREAKR